MKTFLKSHPIKISLFVLFVISQLVPRPEDYSSTKAATQENRVVTAEAKVETAAGGGNAEEVVVVTAVEFGGEWPYPEYQQGRISCKWEKKRPMVLIELGGKVYGMNGAANGMGGYSDSRLLMARDQWGAYDLGAFPKFIQTGLDLCEYNGDVNIFED